MINFYELSLDAVIQGYEDEVQRPREQESGYGFELFRRAIEERNSQAWDVIHQQYNNLIISWIHLATSSKKPSAEQIEDLAQEIWMKYYRNLAKTTSPLSERFKHIGAFLGYLKRCVFTVITDHYRRQTKFDKLEVALRRHQDQFYAPPDALVLDRLSKQNKMQVVKEWIANHVTDEEERIVFRCSYVLELTPGEICREYPDKFPNVKRIYRIKERLLKRAKRFFEAMGIEHA
ncbi:MAG: RNA polymerase sigma factor [Ardenticatenaceae bacterium]